MAEIVKNNDVFRVMEQWAPSHLAFDWDNVGLQIGSYSKPVKKVMITLDVLEAVVDEAIEKEADLIIAHHPLLFKPLKQINFDSPQGRTLQKLTQHNITVYAAHTNLDSAQGGVNDMLCDLLGINNRTALETVHKEEMVKIAVYVPTTHAEIVKEALGNAGAGHIGNYSHCTFQTKGQGAFKPLSGTNPFIGSIGELEKVEEVKIETIVPKQHSAVVVQEMIKSHPYEEPAYDIYPLENSGQQYGLGRIGELEKTMTLTDLCEHVKQVLDVPHVRVTGDLQKTIRKVAVLGGSGEKYAYQAKKQGADAYITGDMTFHAAQDAWQMDLSVIDPGHHVEKVMKKAVKKYLERELEQKVEIIISEVNTEPFQFI